MANQTPYLNIDGKSIPEIFLRRVEIQRDQRAFLVKNAGAYRPVSWDQVYRRVVKLAHYLKRQKIQPLDRVAIFSNTRLEWTVADLAIMGCGATTVPIYQSASIEEIEYVLSHSGAKMIFVEDSSLFNKLLNATQKSKKTLPIVSFQPLEKTGLTGNDWRWIEYQTVTEGPASPEEESFYRQSVESIQSDAPASIVYTSGTTGQPKGAVLQQSCFTSEVRAICNVLRLGPQDISLAFLPFAHVFGRVESFTGLYSGMVIAFAENFGTMAHNMMEVKPTFLAGVPRIYEKIYSKMLSDVERMPILKKQLFQWAVSIGCQVADLESAQKPVPLSLRVQHTVATKAVLSKIRERFGGRIRSGVAGGAPMARELTQFFFACGIPILEGYGLTETTAAICLNTFESYGFGVVGKPLPGMEIRIAPDGEILLKGPMVFQGYHNNTEATKAAFTSDGWFCTGDIGEITPTGSVRITDRKKELIVTSGGKNIAPQKLEGVLKQSPWVSNAMVYGDKQKYLVALVTLNDKAVKTWFKEHGKPLPSDMASNEDVRALAAQSVKKLNETVASYEGVKHFQVIPADFSVETGELTPSLKLKRKVIAEKYRSEIESMYS